MDRDRPDEIRLGIDLGTTNSVVAVVRGPRPEVLLDTNDIAEVKSMVGPTARGQLVTGNVAYDNWPLKPHDTIYSVKRLMGRGIADDVVAEAQDRILYNIVKPAEGTELSLRVVMDGNEYSPVDVSAEILEKMRRIAEYRLGREITHAVITVPAYFSSKQKAATRDAAMQAGLTVMRLVEEPTAAAYAFGMDSMAGEEQARTVLVYDLGGGTFDISVLVISQQTPVVLNTQGDMWLGGDDFDERIMDYALDRIRRDHDLDPSANKRFMVELRKAARRTKEQLTEVDSATLIVPGVLHDSEGDLIDIEIDFARDELRKMVDPAENACSVAGCGHMNPLHVRRCTKCGAKLEFALIHRTIHLTKKALDEAFLSAEDVDHVLLVGSASRSPLVREAVEELFGKDKVRRDVHPKHCVAMGAAIAARRENRIICPECEHANPLDAVKCAECGYEPLQRPPPPPVPHNYGIQLSDNRMAVFIRKGDSYPTPKESRLWQEFRTTKSNQRILQVPVYGGDDEKRAKSPENEHQGDACALLPAKLPGNTPVRVKLWLDKDQAFHLDMKLGDNSNVPFGLLRGELDHAALEALAEVQLHYFDALKEADPELVSALELGLNDCFDLWARGKYDEAIKEAERLKELAKVDPKAKLANLVDFAEGCLDWFSWAMHPDKVFRLKNVISDAKDALKKGDEDAVEEVTEKIDKETDDFGENANILVHLRGAISAGIGPVDRIKATSLLRELHGLCKNMEKDEAGAGQELTEFVKRVAGELPPVPPSARCENCGQHPGNGMICEHCRHSQILLTKGVT